MSRSAVRTTYCSTSPKCEMLATVPPTWLWSRPGSASEIRMLSGRTAASAGLPDGTRSSGEELTNTVPSFARTPLPVDVPRQKLLRPMKAATNADAGRPRARRARRLEERP